MGKLGAIVFTQAYNAESTVGRAIESILNQTRTDFKYFILDNGSKDETSRVINRYAKEDSRIEPLRIRDNNIANGSVFWKALTRSSEAEYTFWLDADDEYLPVFYETTSQYAKAENLDLVMCGYDCIDGKTGELTKRRAKGERQVVTAAELAHAFMMYRGYTVSTWAKLYRTRFLTGKTEQTLIDNFTTYNDSIHGLFILTQAERFGVVGEPLYKYYQYHYSAKHYGDAENLFGVFNNCQAIKNYLAAIGNTSLENEEYCYAIMFDLIKTAIEDAFESLRLGQSSPGVILQLLGHHMVHDVFSMKAPAQFKILATRLDWLRGLSERMTAYKTGNEDLDADASLAASRALDALRVLERRLECAELGVRFF